MRGGVSVPFAAVWLVAPKYFLKSRTTSKYIGIIAHMHQETHAIPQWARAKSIRQTRGFTAPQLVRYAQAGLIRSSHIRRPGQSRGVKLFNLYDLDRLIADSIDNQQGYQAQVDVNA